MVSLRTELVADAVGFDQLDARFAFGVAGLVDEVLAVDVHAAADERLAFLERKPARHFAAGRPQGEVGFGGAVPLRVGRLRLDADAVAGRVDRHVGDQLPHEPAVLVQVARLADQLGADTRREFVAGVGWRGSRHVPRRGDQLAASYGDPHAFGTRTGGKSKCAMCLRRFISGGSRR